VLPAVSPPGPGGRRRGSTVRDRRFLVGLLCCEFLGELIMQIFRDIAPQNPVTRLAQMDLIAPEKRTDWLMVRTKQIGKDIDIIGIRLGPKKVVHQLIESLDVVNVFEASRARLD
jgi:hypothetical protein